MENQTTRPKFWRVVPVMLILLALLVSGGIALAGVPTSMPQSKGAAPAAQANGGSGADKAQSQNPITKPDNSKAPAALGDVLFTIDVAANTSPSDDIALGVQYLGGFYWATGRNSGDNIPRLWKLDTSGTQVAVYTQDTCGSTTFGYRDLAYDGTYLYASDECGVDKVDPATGTRVGGFPNPAGLAGPARALTYDPATSHFYSANFNSSIVIFDNTGAVVNTLPADGLNHYGFGWDAVSPGGPFLWSFSQDGPEQLQVNQINPATGVPTGVMFNPARIATGDIAGGADVTDQLGNGTLTLVAMHQSDANSIRGYDLGVPVGGGTPTSTSTPALTPTATPSCTAGGEWTAGADLPFPLVRSVGVYFPPNGKLYSMGGRQSDSAGSDQLNPLEYDPTSNTWTVKSASYDDNQVNNQACGVLTQGGTPYIFCVGGSAAGASTSSSEVRRYDPATDTLTVMAGDNWPGNTDGAILPGGFAVANNKLYILGGFDINIASTNQIWEYDPNASGAHWIPKSSVTPVGIMYAPTAAVGNIVYVLGASDYQGGTVVDTNTTFGYDTTSDTIDNSLTAIPRATGETRALNVGGQLWVMGGGRVAPNPSNEVDIYNPGADSWSVGTPFNNARRNFLTDTDGSTVWLAGGYDVDGITPLSSMEIFTPGGCGTATPTSVPPTSTNTPVPATATNTTVATVTTGPTDTATTAPTQTPGGNTATPVPSDTATTAPTQTPGGATATSVPSNTPGVPTATPTACTLSFRDVPVGSTFYTYIRCLACKGIINGYPDGTFRPNANVTRGQLSKIVSNSAGFDDTPTGQQFQDVPPSGQGSTFYVYIYRLVHRGFINGYPCGQTPTEPCIGPGNLPYFRPNANSTRGQISKIVSNAAGFSETPVGQDFQDVPIGSTFYDYIYRLVHHGVMSGYPCGQVPSEPCVSPGNLPYFRPNNNATRGQTSKIVANTFFPNCEVTVQTNR